MSSKRRKRTPRKRIVGRAPRPRSGGTADDQKAASTPASNPENRLSEAAFQARVAELRRLPARSIASINLSVPNVVATVLGVVPKLRAQLPALRDAVVRFDFELVEQLEEWALVLNRLHAAALVPEQPSAISNAEIEEARQLRRLLAGDATTLAGRGLLSKSEVAAIGSGNGFLKLSQDLRKLHRLFVSNAAALRGRCAVTEVELARALKLSDKLQALIIQRAQPRPHSGAELERRAFTRLMAAYREARAGIVFLRRNEGDYDEIIPSLYVGRKRRTISKSDLNARNQQT